MIAAARETGPSAPFTLRDYPGSLAEYIDELYWQYRIMVGAADLRLFGKPVVVSGCQEADGRDAIFWHLITRHPHWRKDLPRELCLERCAELPRLWQILGWLADGEPRVCCWRQTANVVKVAPLDFSYVVVLRETTNAFRLKAAYPMTTAQQSAELFAFALHDWHAAGQPESGAPAPAAAMSRPNRLGLLGRRWQRGRRETLVRLFCDTARHARLTTKAMRRARQRSGHEEVTMNPRTTTTMNAARAI